MELKKLKHKFNVQRCVAKNRGIEWKLTFEEWINWWGEDINKRGRGIDKLQMQRFLDKGAYELGNIKKGYPNQNSSTYSAMHKKRKADRAKAEHEKFLDSLMFMKSAEDKEEKEYYVSEYAKEMESNGNAVFVKFVIDK